MQLQQKHKTELLTDTHSAADVAAAYFVRQEFENTTTTLTSYLLDTEASYHSNCLVQDVQPDTQRTWRTIVST